jgi:hypothetical protein
MRCGTSRSGSVSPSANAIACGSRLSRAAIQPPLRSANAFAWRNDPRIGMVSSTVRVAAWMRNV